ncbi:MAG: bifunctional methylenetetrahydrofolate dehydrogenase/methenyltetrahydrofolate cyclohydrolase FolD [Actinomycetota bacterium]|nr:bifunctional methylenetetrahydrofolate dehydrogenase/methenyltetrahydrofolate cyclohydrolase FolD [Actinomycetota bacterium]
MAATIIDGKAIAQQVRAEVARDVAALTAETGAAPGLATVLVGDDPASDIYVSGKQRACREVGIDGFDHRLAADASQAQVAELLHQLDDDPRVNGILLQLPVPDHLDGAALTGLISPAKDVDGLTPISAGLLAQGRPGLRPCTPSGVIELLDRHDVELQGAEAVVLGRSLLVGRPLASLLLERHATVTVCHSRTRDLPAVCVRADVLVAAVGVPRLVGPDHVKPGAAVIDVGINRTDEGVVGDVDFDAVRERAGLLTPVPGGVGPMTIAMLLRNTVLAARATVAADGTQATPAG